MEPDRLARIEEKMDQLLEKMTVIRERQVKVETNQKIVMRVLGVVTTSVFGYFFMLITGQRPPL